MPAIEAPTEHSTQEKYQALLVEDNPGDARLIELMIEQAGGDVFQLEHVERLSDAIMRAEEGGLGIVLLDLSLPDSHGLDTFAKLHARAPHLPIIVLSGLNDTRLAVQAVHDGAQDYLIKGEVEGQLLVRAMQYAMERKRLTRQLAEYAEELRAKNAQLEADFNMARDIQQVFLPNRYPTFPKWASPSQSALKFYHRYIPAAAVGGDFFDVFAITGTTAGVFICDVMGHGMRAALITAIMRGLLEELMPVAADPGRFLGEVNRSLHAILKRTHETFLATAFYLVADCDGDEVRFSSAGHPSPLRARRDAGTVEPLKQYDPRHGPALGLFEKSSYPTCRCPISNQDLLVMFTDGLYEAQSPQKEEYGIERLQDALRSRLRLSPDDMFDQTLEEVRMFSASPEFDDDVCLVGLEFAGKGSLSP